MRFTLSVSEKWLSKQSVKRRILVQLVATLVVSLFLITLAIWAYYNWIIGFRISLSELYVFLAIYGTIGLLYNALFFSNFYLNRENTLLIQQEKASGKIRV